MLLTAPPSLLESIPVPRSRGECAPRLTRRVGISATLLAHLLLLLLLFRQTDPLVDAQTADPGLQTLSAFWVPAPNVASTVQKAAVAKPAPSKPLPPKPRIKPSPQPVAPQADARIVALAPTATSTTAPAPPATPPDAAESAALAETAPAATAATAASPPPAAGEASNIRSTASPYDLEKLERQYARLVSRTISFNQHYPVYSKQFGESGTALVRISLARNGSVLDAVLVTPTGFRYLDDEARNVILRVAKFAPVPALIRQGSEVVVIDQPVRFQLR